MNPILAKVQEFLYNAYQGKSNIPSELLEEFKQGNLKILDRHFNVPAKDKFTLRMSSIGRPLCQLQLEQQGIATTPEGYNSVMRNSYGDMIEMMVIVILKAAGVNVQSCFGECSLDIGGIRLKGTYDVIIDNKLYDIKSASAFAFNHKFNVPDGFYSIANDDSFGYVSQGYLYAQAMGIPFGGWIAVSKETGEWAICEPPAADEHYRKQALEIAERNIVSLLGGTPFKRLFDDVEETFKRKKTGNRVLGRTCEYCRFQMHCWPQLQIKPNVNSDARDPRLTYYTYLQEN